jgi:hypothetical protein
VQSTGPSPLNAFLSSLGMLVAIVCYSRREDSIGGWLLYFYCQIYIWAVVLLLRSISIVASLYPAWPASRSVQSLPMLLAVLPRLAGVAGVAIVATALLKFRDWLWVKRLRFAIAAGLVLVGISVVADWMYFPTVFVPNLSRWLVLCLWLAYFLISVRVRLVFLTKNWGEVPVGKLFE